MGGAQGGQAREGAGAQRALGPLSPLQRGRAAADGPNRSAGEAPSWSFFFFIIKKICHRTIRFIIYFLLIFLF